MMDYLKPPNCENKQNISKYRLLSCALGVLLITCLSSCASNKNLSGERVLLTPDIIAAGLDLPSVAIKLPKKTLIKDWKQRDFNPDHNPPHFSLNDSLKRKWALKVGASGFLTTPIVLEKTIFCLDGKSKLVSIDLEGNINWSVSISPKTDKGEKSFGGGLAVASDLLVATTGFGEIIAFDSRSGDVLWRHSFSAPFRGAPVIKGKNIYAVTSDDMALSISKTGKLRWTKYGPTAVTGLEVGPAPAVKGNTVFMPYSGGMLSAIRSSDGVTQWSVAFDKANSGLARSVIGDFAGSPVITRKSAYMMSNAGQLLSVKLNNGAIRWRLAVGGQSTPLIVDNSIFVVTDTGKIARIKTSSGSLIWSRKISSKDLQGSYYGPVLGNGLLWVVGSDKKLRAFNPASGEEILSLSLSHSATGGPVIAGGVIYVVTSSGTLVAFE